MTRPTAVIVFSVLAAACAAGVVLVVSPDVTLVRPVRIFVAVYLGGVAAHCAFWAVRSAREHDR